MNLLLQDVVGRGKKTEFRVNSLEISYTAASQKACVLKSSRAGPAHDTVKGTPYDGPRHAVLAERGSGGEAALCAFGARARFRPPSLHSLARRR